MNESDFRLRIYSNPLEDDSEILELTSSDPKLAQIWEETRNFEQEIQNAVAWATPSAGLMEKLLTLPDNANQHAEVLPDSVAEQHSANDSHFRYFAVAASLLLVLGVVFSLNFSPVSEPSAIEVAFGKEVIQHLYHEEVEIDAINAGSNLPQVGMPMIRNAMAPVGAQLGSSGNALAASVRFAKPCVVIPAFESAHLILQGAQGAVNIIVINNSPVSMEYSISDDRFRGIVVPMEKGNLVLIGEANADLTEYKKLVAESVDWVI